MLMGRSIPENAIMDSIVLHSDVARLVLGYLVNQNLRRAAHTLCRTSPYLQHEFMALKQGLQTHNFLNGGLEGIICEHVKITGLVANALQKLPLESRHQLQQLTLSERVNELMKMSSTLDRSSISTNESSTPGGGGNEASTSQTHRKRRRLRTQSPVNCLSWPSISKRPRLLPPHFYCSLSNRDKPKLSFLVRQDHEDNETAETSSTATEDLEEELPPVNGPGPRSNSTPRQSHAAAASPLVLTPQSMPELASAIIKNQDFQNTLVNNINMALQTVTVNNPTVSCDAVLDSLVKNILEATEKDPSFDRIIQEVVTGDPPHAMAEGESPPPASEKAPAVVAEPTMADAHAPTLRAAVATSIAEASTVQVPLSSDPADAVNPANSVDPVPPQTPLIIRTAGSVDPNFSISKLIVLNTNESVQKMLAGGDLANVSFASDALNLNFGDPAAMLTEAEAAAAGQVCVDTTTGQLTFPMYLSNSGLLSHFPFLVNNEWVTQQLGPDAFANMDDSHIEISLPEPITLSAHQLPPNSIIINSAQKQEPPPPTVEPPAQLITDVKKSQVKGSPPAAEQEEHRKMPPASLDSSRQVLERGTPSTARIINVKAFRSLSTPRKRTSHVRTLSFSPKNPPGSAHHPITPLSTRRPGLLAKAKEKPIINHVEIIQPACDLSSSDGHGGVPPLFAMEEGSNQTVINAHPPAPAANDPLVATPRRKQKRQAAVRACKRIISHEENESRQEKEKPEKQAAKNTSAHDDSAEASKENLQGEQQKAEGKPGGDPGCPVSAREASGEEDMLAAWQRQLHASSIDLENRLREINSKREETVKVVGRNRRPKKKETPSTVAAKARRKPFKKPAQRGGGDCPEKISIKIATPKSLKKRFTQATKEQEEEKLPPLEEEVKDNANEKEKDNANEKEKKKEKEKEKDTEKVKKIRENELEQQEQQEHQEQEALSPPNMALLLDTPFKASSWRSGTSGEAPATGSGEAEGCTTSGVAATVPPTPGMAIAPLDTPYGKMPSSSFLFGSDTKSIMNTPQLSAITPGFRCTPFSQVPGTPMGSAAKTEYSSGSSYYRPDEAEHTDANAQCAIQQWEEIQQVEEQRVEENKQPTPKKKEKDKQPKEQSPKLRKSRDGVPKEELHRGEEERHLHYMEQEPVVLVVEPTVLRRVRSFGSEEVDSAEPAAAGSCPSDQQQPHYKLMLGLPEAITEGSSSSSSSTTSSSSSSSSGSSSSSSSSSSQSSQSEKETVEAANELASEAGESPEADGGLLNIDNLSNISSTEDEEWLRAGTGSQEAGLPMLAVDSQPGQLLSQDGEVRYPIRNWLTPSKEQGPAPETNTSGEARGAAPPSPTPPPLPPPETVEAPVSAPPPLAASMVLQEQRQQLDEKRQRVVAKVKLAQPAIRMLAKNTAVKKLVTMRETAKLASPSCHKSPKKREHREPPAQSSSPPKIVVRSKEVKDPTPAVIPRKDPPASGLDPALLMALNLSAKKQEPPTASAKPKVARAAVQIAAQPAPGKRGRPKKTSTLPKLSMRRSSRLVDNKTAPEHPLTTAPTDGELTMATAKSSTKKPAKKRAEARVSVFNFSSSANSAVPQPLPMVAEDESTQASCPKQQQQEKSPHQKPSQDQPCPAGDSDHELDMCLSSSQQCCTFHFSYADNGPKPSNPMVSPSASYFKHYHMRLMTEDDQLHTMRVASAQVLHLGQPLASAIRNIPKKRIRRLTSNSATATETTTVPGPTASASASAGSEQPSATSTPLVDKPPPVLRVKPLPQDDYDQKVAAINTTPKKATRSSGGVQVGVDNRQEGQPDLVREPLGENHTVEIEDIESILSHLHGT